MKTRLPKTLKTPAKAGRGGDRPPDPRVGAKAGNVARAEAPPEQCDELLKTLKSRFENNMNHHHGLRWTDVEAKLRANPEKQRKTGTDSPFGVLKGVSVPAFRGPGDTQKLWSLNEMEITGGEPDIVGYDEASGEYLFVDCSEENPKGRRSLCYDGEALEGRKEHKPADSAMNLAAAMGVELLTEDQYRALQKLGVFDTKTSSWVTTPPNIRKLGGALFCDRRYDAVFVYHNGAESYYAARGFRGALRV